MAARKPSKSVPAKSAPAKVAPVVSTPVRNSAIPPKMPAAAPVRKIVTHEAIAIRAYEISRSGMGGSEDQNWLQAERELNGL